MAGPGHYKITKNFGEDVKSFTIGTKTETKIEITAGPGQYDAERSHSVTKSRSKAALIGKDKARPDTFASEAHVGTVAPGQYDDGIRFNSNVKSFKIGEKREEKIVSTMGPGAYDFEKADTVTKTKIVNINMGSSPSRPTSFAKGGDVNVAPGQYDDGIRFNSNVKSFKIGTKSEAKIETTAGPGQYDAERSHSVTKSRSKAALIGRDKARPDTFASEAHVGTTAPG